MSRVSVGRRNSCQQSASGPPMQQFVSVAVLTPRLPQGLAPSSGIAAADAFNWDERINWTHNEPIAKDAKPEKRAFLKKAGLTTERKKRNEDTPPFQFRQVPYDEWRKHYAKDKDGNYQGTHAPAEDCLLKPEDVARWRLGEAKTKADLCTRGSERLPVYEEARQEGAVPGYHEVPEDGNEALRQTQTSPAVLDRPPEPRREIMGGKSAQEIIVAEEEKNRSRPKGNMTWKERVKRGAEIASMGSGGH